MIWTNVPHANRLRQPAVNTIETAEAYTLELALPGWQKEHVELRVDGELLIVKGELTDAPEADYRRREFGISQFEKSFHLPETVDVEAVAATLDHGVLSIELPKVPEAQPVRKQIAIA